jgi:formylglycine-generating enzyme required for sulfatase activity
MHQKLGDFELIKELGDCSFGKIYLAKHHFTKKQYCIKTLSKTWATKEHFLTKFKREIAQLAKLEHPNLVKIEPITNHHDVFFVASEFITLKEDSSQNLQQFIQNYKRAIPEDLIETIAIQMASALDYAHDKSTKTYSFIHYNLKPSNILIGKNKTFHLADFGLAKLIGQGAILEHSIKAQLEAFHADNDLSISALSSSFLNTYLYFSPEQKWYHKEKVGIKSDVYSFGVVLYYLLTKHFPEGNYLQPSQLRKDLSKDWDRLIQLLLQQDIDKRPPSLTEALQDVLHSFIKKPLMDLEKEITKVQQSAQQKSQLEKTLQDVKQHPLFPSKSGSDLNTQSLVRLEGEFDPRALIQTEMKVSYYNPQQVTTKIAIEPILSEMKVVEGKTFMRGSKHGPRDEMPQHAIRVNSFVIEEHPVTNEQFARFLHNLGDIKDANHNDMIKLKDSRLFLKNGEFCIETNYEKHPVVGVTWYGAYAYAQWIGRRLPTEAEWELAASNGNSENIYPFGQKVAKSKANYFSADTTPIKHYPPSEIGLYDMAGNVYEWCQDWYDFHYYEYSKVESNNPKGPKQGVYRVLRGGCWKSLDEDLRCAHRHRNNPGHCNATYGFRCACNLNA